MTPVAVIITIAAYLCVLFAVSWFSGRRSDNAGFFVGNHRTTWYMSAMAMISAAMSGVTFVSVPGSVAADSFSYLQMVMGFTVGQCILAFVMLPMFYRRRVVSLYEYLDDRFGVTAHRTGAAFFLLSKILGASLKIFPVCAVMQMLVFDAFRLPFGLNAAVTMLLVWLYTGRGGVKSLVWTDSLKTLCLVSSLVLSIVFISKALGLSFGGMMYEIGESSYSRIFFFDDPSSSRYFWKMFWAGVFVLIAMTGLDQDMMQLNISCRTKRDAQTNVMITALCQIVIIAMLLMLGVLLYMYASRTGMTLPEKSDQLFAKVAADGGLPVTLGVVFVLGLVACTYSTAGSALTALTTSFTVDILRGRERFDERKLTRVRHLVHTVMAVIIGVTIVLFEMWSSDSIINLVYKVVSYTYGPLLGMFAFGALCKWRIHDKWLPVVAVAAPLLSAVLQYGARRLFGYEIGFELLIYNALLTMLGMAILIKK